MATTSGLSPFARLFPSASPSGAESAPAAEPASPTAALGQLQHFPGPIARGDSQGCYVSRRSGYMTRFAGPSNAPSSPTLQALRNRGFGASKAVKGGSPRGPTSPMPGPVAAAEVPVASGAFVEPVSRQDGSASNPFEDTNPFA